MTTNIGMLVNLVPVFGFLLEYSFVPPTVFLDPLKKNVSSQKKIICFGLPSNNCLLTFKKKNKKILTLHTEKMFKTH